MLKQMGVILHNYHTQDYQAYILVTKILLTHAYMTPRYTSLFQPEHISLVPWVTQHFHNGFVLTLNLY